MNQSCDNCNACKGNLRCCKAKAMNTCELETITASQISSALVFIGFLLSNVYSLLTFHGEDIERFIRIELFLTYVIALVYYFLGCWATEEELIDDLRKLKPSHFYAQWIVRILILVMFGLYTNIIDYVINLLQTFKVVQTKIQVLSNILYLIIMFATFVIWDAIVWTGGQKELVKKYFILDVCGFCILSLLGYAYKVNNIDLLAFMMLLWIFMAIQIGKFILALNPLDSLRRIFSINQIR